MKKTKNYKITPSYETDFEEVNPAGTAIYVRVSTEEQVQEGYSIRAQEQKLKDYARIKEWSIFNIYADEGISGKNIIERPAINRMIEDVKSGKVNNVVVFKIDRLTRSVSDLVYLVNLFNEYDCTFNSLMESIDTQTASGRMFIKIIGIFAEFERENIIERTRLGFERKAREGYSLCSHKKSYGYNRPKGEKIQTINEEEAEIVKEIFDMFICQSMAFTGIAKRLNIKNIKTKFNTSWNNQNIKNVLTNCNYVGKVRYSLKDKKRYFETEGKHEPIITEELFKQAQDIISKMPKISKTKKPKDNNYFVGMLICEKCGKKLSTHNQYYKRKDGIMSVHCHYRCESSAFKACSNHNISHEKLEKAFIKYINIINDFNTIDKIGLEKQEKVKKDNLELIQNYKNKLHKIETREKEAIDLYISAEIDFESYREMKKAIERDKAYINSELKKLDNIEETEERKVKKEDIIINLRENWAKLNDLEKRQFLVRFVKKIIPTAEKIEGSRFLNISIKEIEFNVN
jgi:site-specific DNA recombinase